ncbi:MAG: hypothetical protein AAFP90_13475 [Planctomycetota bacterium]
MATDSKDEQVAGHTRTAQVADGHFQASDTSPEHQHWIVVRRWTDLFPWLGLLGTLRPLASPIVWGLLLFAWAMAAIGQQGIDCGFHYGAAAFADSADGIPDHWRSPKPWLSGSTGRLDQPGVPAFAMDLEPRISILGFLLIDDESEVMNHPGSPYRFTKRVRRLDNALPPAASSLSSASSLLFDTSLSWASALRLICHAICLALAWCIPFSFVIRRGALATADADEEEAWVTLRQLWRRLPRLMLSVLLPVSICFLIFVGLCLLLALRNMVPSLAIGFDCFAILPALALGFLLYTLPMIIGLSWASIVVQQRPSVLDAFSRAMESMLRRPISMLLLMMLGAAVMFCFEYVLTQVYHAGWNAVNASTNDQQMISSVVWSSRGILFLFRMAFLASYTGGMYLMLRRDANEQEVEDVEDWSPVIV